MIVAQLGLTDFRNYAHADLELGPGPNVFVGRNGQGKTNLVESLGYLSTLGSHRVSTDQALIRSGADAAIVRARLQHGERSVLIALQINRSGANRAQVNRVVTKPRELPRYIATVLFAPEDLVLTLNDPGTVPAERVLARMEYAHPVHTPETVAAQRRLPDLNDGVLAYAGAYHGWGFHEDGCRSGSAAARSLGAR